MPLLELRLALFGPMKVKARVAAGAGPGGLFVVLVVELVVLLIEVDEVLVELSVVDELDVLDVLVELRVVDELELDVLEELDAVEDVGCNDVLVLEVDDGDVEEVVEIRLVEDEDVAVVEVVLLVDVGKTKVEVVDDRRVVDVVLRRVVDVLPGAFAPSPSSSVVFFPAPPPHAVSARVAAAPSGRWRARSKNWESNSRRRSFG